MPDVLPGNGLQSTLNGAITNVATTLTIQSADAANWPASGQYRAVLNQDPLNGPWEIVLVTGGQGTATLTVTRAAEPYNGIQTAQAWPNGGAIAAVLTKDGLAGTFLPLVGGTLSGNLIVSGTTNLVGSVVLGTTASTNAMVMVDGPFSAASTTHYGINAQVVFGSGATAFGIALAARVQTAAVAYTMGTAYALYARGPVLGAGSSLTTANGILVANQGAAGITNAYGIFINSQSGASTVNVGLQNNGTSQLQGAVSIGNTLAVTSTVSIGNQAPTAGILLNVVGAISGGGTEIGAKFVPQASAAATSVQGLYFQPTVNNAAVVGSAQGFYIDGPNFGTAACTNYYGLYVANQGRTGTTNAYGVYILAQSGAATLNYGMQIVSPGAAGANNAPLYISATSTGVFLRVDNTAITTAAAGTSGAAPAQVAGYLLINVNGTNQKLAYYNV
jgi:hypothetical protein